MKMTLMGTGTSHGIPVVACSCSVCTSSSPKDKRNRCSAYIEQTGNDRRDYDNNLYPTTNILIDTGPEFRIQCLLYKVKRLDAVLITHSHADHSNGLDDLRIFSHTLPASLKNVDMTNAEYIKETFTPPLCVYSNASCIEDLSSRFSYVFNNVCVGGGIPRLNLLNCDRYNPDEPLSIGSLTIIPVNMMHGNVVDTGYLLSCIGKDGLKHSIAYLTDCSYISDASIDLIKGNSGILDHVVIDGLRKKEHTTHCNFDQALSYADRLGARHTWLTHICHDFSHEDIQKYVSDSLINFSNLSTICSCGGSAGPAYDGLVLEAGE